MSGTKMAVVEQPPLAMEVAQPSGDSLVQMIERVASNPNASMDVLERLMAMHERARAQVAREQFNSALSSAQKEMRPVAADADNPQTRSRYASYNALDKAVRPLYTRHGFGLSFDTADSPLPEHVRVVCDVTHIGGHEKQYHVDMPADGKGAKGGDVMTKTHAAGAAMSYGMRYLLKMIFNIAVGEDDRDGNEGGYIPAPEGYDSWLTTLAEKADEGLPALQAMWKTANDDRELKVYALHLVKTEPATWNNLKAKSAKIRGVK